MTVALPKTDSLFVVNVDYEGYLKIYEALAPNRIRLTYDRGRLEFMSPSPEHERIKAQFSRALEAIFMAFDITEVWRYEQDGNLQLYCLHEGGYVPIERSRFLSQVRLEELQHFVDRGKEIITSKLIREVQAWAREKKGVDD